MDSSYSDAAGFAFRDRAIAKHVHPSGALTLVDAMVARSDGLSLLLDGNLAIVAVSNSFCRNFDLEPTRIVGKQIFSIGEGEWDLTRLRSLLTAVAGGAKTSPYEIVFESRGKLGTRCLEIHAQKLDYDVAEVVRLLVAVVDLTDARADKIQIEQLVADKVVLNRELQRRVANSLQIIASVLMQSANRVSSEDGPTHHHKGHNRLISISEVQRQLASTGADSVALRPYLTQLCASISASMIHDSKRLNIKVEVDESEVSSEVSISLGLIVTELVINAIKHGFPDDRSGKIKVDFAGNGASGSWMLEVMDDGIGMSTRGLGAAAAGLGTSIVEALVRQQRAKLTIEPRSPGTIISISHEPTGKTSTNVFPLGRAV